jgi:hypothetical protein
MAKRHFGQNGAISNSKLQSPEPTACAASLAVKSSIGLATDPRQVIQAHDGYALIEFN